MGARQHEHNNRETGPYCKRRRRGGGGGGGKEGGRGKEGEREGRTEGGREDRPIEENRGGDASA